MFNRFLQGIITVGTGLAAFSILATAMYYVMPVTTVGLIGCAFVAITVVIWLQVAGCRLGSHPEPNQNSFAAFSLTSNQQPATSFLFMSSLLSLGLWWHAVLTHPIVEAVRSPWLVISPGNLIWLFVPVVCVVIMMRGSTHGSTRTAGAFVIIVLTLFSALSFAAAAYPLGFGFDPFLHRATIQHIADFGTINPKPLYYIGEYVIELFAIKVFHLPLMLVDTYLVPMLAAILIPAAVWKGSASKPTLTAAMLLFLPMTAFVQTTPQALAFVFTAVAVLLASDVGGDGSASAFAGASSDRSKPTLTAAIFALAALCAHPIAGLPAVFFVAMTVVGRGKEGGSASKPTPTTAIAVLATIALPLAFIAQSLKAHMPLGLHLPSLHDLTSLPLSMFIGTRYDAWGDIVYLIIGNFFVVTVILGIVGAWRVGRHRSRPVHMQQIPLVCAGIAFANFLILGLFFDFPFLISYERADFALRMLTLTVIFLLPYVPYAIKGVGIEADPYKMRQAFVAIMIGIVFVSTVYGAYPRHDAYASSAGFNVTQADFDAVMAIDNYAAGRDYVVLANQSTSSAAIGQLGFKKYYHGDIFFYPIPTGGKLYDLYLQMADSPSVSIIDEARQLTGAQLVFFVMDDYWWDSKKVIEQTKTITDTSWTFGGHEVTVMVFE